MWDAQKTLDAGGKDFALPFETAHFLDGFETPDRKFHFKPDWKRFGGRWEEMPVLPDHMDVIDNFFSSKRRHTIFAPVRGFLKCAFTQTPGSLSREKRPTVRIHPEDCAALGVKEGDRVRLGNERGEVIVHVMPQAGQQRSVAVVEGIWPNRYFENGIGINAVTSSQPGWPNGGAVFHDTAVWIKAA